MGKETDEKLQQLFRKEEDFKIGEVVFKYKEPSTIDSIKLSRKWRGIDIEKIEETLKLQKEQTLLYFKTYVMDDKEIAFTGELYDKFSTTVKTAFWRFVADKQSTASFLER